MLVFLRYFFNRKQFFVYYINKLLSWHFWWRCVFIFGCEAFNHYGLLHSFKEDTTSSLSHLRSFAWNSSLIDKSLTEDGNYLIIILLSILFYRRLWTRILPFPGYGSAISRIRWYCSVDDGTNFFHWCSIGCEVNLSFSRIFAKVIGFYLHFWRTFFFFFNCTNTFNCIQNTKKICLKHYSLESNYCTDNF